jgi:lipoprotein-releasing system permease protein
MSYLIVTNINEIHDWLGESMGLYVWDPKVYYFSEIPAKFKWIDASIVLVSGVVASGVGAFIPAIRAARMDPVRALRFE